MQDLKEFVRRNEDRELDEEEKVKEEEIMAEEEFLLLFFCVFLTVKMKKNRISTDPASSVSVIVSLLNDITACNTA